LGGKKPPEDKPVGVHKKQNMGRNFMRKERIKGLIAGILLTVLIFTSVTMVSASTRRSVNANIVYDNIRIMIDGVETTLTDLEGRAIEPFIMDGAMYVPISPLVRQFGRSSVYDGTNRILAITTPTTPPPRPRMTYFFDVLTAYENSNDTIIGENQNLIMLGDEYTNCWYFTTNRWNSVDAYVLYNLRGHHKAIKGILGHVDGTYRGGTGTLSIYLDNKLYTAYTLESSMLPTEIILDVTGVNIMKIEFSFDRGGEWWREWHSDRASYGFGNVTVE
jgi:hypothetical protein